MLQSFRERLSGTIAVALIVLIAIPLAFFGVDSLFLNNTRILDVAEVNGKEITETDLNRAVIGRRNQIAQMLGENYSPDLVTDEQLRSAAMQELVVQKLLASAADDLGMGISDAQIVDQLRAVEGFQLDGQFSEALFSNYLVTMGYTSSSFLEAFADELKVFQLSAALRASALATDNAVDQLISVLEETRSYQYVELPVDDILDDVDISEDQVLAFYDSHPDQFEQAERVSVDYLTIDRDLFIDQVEATDVEVMERFTAMQTAQPARREVAHILVEGGEGADEKLQQVRERLDGGEAFSSVVADLSDDLGSSSNEGYLGFTSGDTFPDEFEAAVATLDVGAVSDPVETEAGYHFIKLLSEKISTLDLETEYAGLELDIKQEKAEDLYVVALEEFTQAALETDDLEQLIEEMESFVSLQIETSAPFERESGTGIAGNPTVRSVAYSPLVLEDRLNSEAIEISDTRALVLHLNSHIPAGVAPLESVRDTILNDLRIDAANTLLKDTAQAYTDQLAEGANLEELARNNDLEWHVKLDQQRSSHSGIEGRIFEVELTGELPIAGNTVLPEGGYVVYRLDAVEAGSIHTYPDSEQRRLRTQLGRQFSAEEFYAYTETLRDQADIDIKISLEEEM